MDALREGISEKNFAQARDGFGSLPASLLEDDKWALEVDEFGETILQKAANAGEEDIMRLLITKLKNESLILATDAEGRSLLHFAVLGGDMGTVASLVGIAPSLAAVADSEGGLLPIHLAARDGLADVLGLLFRKSDINAQDKNGQTPLHFAVVNKRSDVVKLLLERGANKAVKNSRGKTALDVAKESDSIDLVQILS